MSLTYTTYVAALSDLTVIPSTDSNFQTILPDCIDYAEQRIYREADFLDTIVRDSSSSLTVGTRTFNLPSSIGRFVVVNGVNVITPYTAGSADAGTRNRLEPVSLDALDILWPSTASASLPVMFAMVTDQQVVVGPAPDVAYPVEVIGTIRPAPLSATNTTTYLTLYLPDLFLAASMVFMSGYMRNFGSQSDDPRMAASWEDQYQKLFQSVNVEEMKKKFAVGPWASLQPTPLTSSQRQ